MLLMNQPRKQKVIEIDPEQLISKINHCITQMSLICESVLTDQAKWMDQA